MTDVQLGALLSLWIPGRARTKGSLKCIGRVGKNPHQMVEDHALSAPWRKTMQKAVIEYVRSNYLQNGQKWQPISDPLKITATFYYERPSTGMGVDLPFPTINQGINAAGDLDKLTRNLLDALEGCGFISDDCMVVGLDVRKRWAGKNLPAGVQVSVTRAAL